MGVPGAFPPLAGNPAVGDAAHLRQVIRNGLSGPLTVLGETYDGQMPALPQLSDAQIDAVIAYLQTLIVAPPGTTSVPGPAAGDPARGEDLFTGAQRLSKGGPACAACHASGAGLGPDLAGAFTRLGGEAGLGGWLAAPPSPTMQPVFASSPLSEAEIADLTAHLEVLEAGGRETGLDWFPFAGLGGVLALLGFMLVVVKGPRTTYADRLRSEA